MGILPEDTVTVAIQAFWIWKFTFGLFNLGAS